MAWPEVKRWWESQPALKDCVWKEIQLQSFKKFILRTLCMCISLQFLAYAVPWAVPKEEGAEPCRHLLSSVFFLFPLKSLSGEFFSDWNLWPSLLLETKARHPGLFTAWFLLWNCAYLMALRIWQMFFSLRNLFFIIVQQFARGTSAVEQREMSGDLEQFSVLFSVASSRWRVMFLTFPS